MNLSCKEIAFFAVSSCGGGQGGAEIAWISVFLHVYFLALNLQHVLLEASKL
jgi:hypothetical protein